MRWDKLTVTGAVALSLCTPRAVQAQDPTFDCSKVQAGISKLICSDAAMASLDRKLDAVYKAALARAGSPLAVELRQAQRGWIKARDECWKSNGQETWITATWTVNTVQACIDAQYRLRTSELQAVWRLLPPRTFAFACQGNPANEVVVNLFDTDPPTIRLERGDRTTTLWRVGLASAGLYEGQNVSVLLQADNLKLSWFDTQSGKADELQCTSR